MAEDVNSGRHGAAGDAWEAGTPPGETEESVHRRARRERRERRAGGARLEAGGGRLKNCQELKT